MIDHVAGNILDADAEALVNTVNTVGVMGKGIALQFRQAFPGNYAAYVDACKRQEVTPGRMFVYHTGRLSGPRYVINFPTKRHWKGKSRVEDIESGLCDLVEVVKREGIKSIAVPPLGCGNGGLKWTDVRPRIEAAFEPLSNVTVLVYVPAGAPAADKMRIATKRPNMTPARAALVSLLESYALPGYRLTMLEIQKLAYLLQAAGEPLNLKFVKAEYGPYAETLNHVLQRIEGHFIRGYGDRSSNASIRVLPDAISEARRCLESSRETRERLARVARLIEGFETPYGMELLTTVHWIAKENQEVEQTLSAAMNGVQSWNARKRANFRPEHIEAVWDRLRDCCWVEEASSRPHIL
jgi:O-acetyl-ADP-ribose deacetylase (regulator of RNase III)